MVYVNWARVLMSPYDLVLDLGFRTENAPPTEFPVRTVMSWEQAKALATLLAAAVSEYEEEVGEVREFGEEVLPARPVIEAEAVASDEEET